MRRVVALLLVAALVGSCSPQMTLARRLLLSGSGSGSFTPAVAHPPYDASWTRSGSNPILTPTAGWEQTATGEWGGVIQSGGAWKTWYTGGWSNSATGYATSTDGITWTKYASNPVYGQGGSGYANSSASPWVLLSGSTFYLYVSGGTSPSDLRSTFRVATSTDGIAWTTQSSSISFPTGGTLWGNRVVWLEGSTWKMLQEVNNGTIWQIYSYTSSDGLTWSIANGGNALSTLQVHAGGSYGGPRFARDSLGAITPKFGGVYHLWYHAVNGTGNLPTDIYEASSSDLVTWTIGNSGAPVLTHTGRSFEVDQVAGPVPIIVAGTAYLFYDGDNNAASSSKGGVATAPAAY